jgi:hypothetical protein
MLQSSTPARQVAALALVAALLVFTCNTAIEMRRSAIRNMSQRAYNSRPLADRVHPLPRIAHVMSTTGTEELRVMRLFNTDWDFRVYDLAGADAYMWKHCPQYYRTFTTVVPIAYKSDVFRLCALWSEAGLYIDDDMLPLQPLSEIAIANSDGLLLVDDRPHTNWWGRTIYNGTYNGFIGATRRHDPFFSCALSHIQAVVMNRAIPTVGNTYLAITGPQALTPCAGRHVYRFEGGFLATGACYDGHTQRGCDLVAIHKPYRVSPNRSKSYIAYDVQNPRSIYNMFTDYTD